MRRTVAVLLLSLAMLVAALGTSGRPGSEASAAEIAPLAAVSADSVVDAYGVGIHLAFLDTPYKDATAVADALDDLGVRHVRDDLFMNNPRQYAGIRTVADKGVKFNLIMGNPTSPQTPAEYVDTVATQLPPGAVESVEGTNEWDLFSRGSLTWATDVLTHQQELYRASKANPATADLPVIGPALAFRWNYVSLPDLTPYADYANGHMYPGGYQPSNEVSRVTTAIRGVIGQGKPLVTTEAGYHNAVNTTNGHLPVPEDVAGVYMPRLLLEHYLKGEKRLYSYELIDEFDDPGKTNPEAHFGLLRRDLSPKPAYSAMKNLLGLVDDPGASFLPAALPVKVEGYPGDGRYVLTQKRNGQHVLFLWRDVSVYDPVLKQPTTVTPTNVTLKLAQPANVKVFRPSQGAAAVTQTQTSSLPLTMDGSVTAITIDKLTPAPAPTSVAAVAGNRSASVSWQLPQTDADVSGFEVVRQPGNVTIPAAATARSVTDTGLTNGAGYTYTVRALSPDGASPTASSPSVIPGTVPDAPKISSTTVGSKSITLKWAAANAQGRAVTGYEIIRPDKSVATSAATRSLVLKGFTAGKKVRLGLRAKNAFGWSAVTWSPYVTPKK